VFTPDLESCGFVSRNEVFFVDPIDDDNDNDDDKNDDDDDIYFKRITTRGVTNLILHKNRDQPKI
jgi:hypothetical protein